MPSFRSLEMIQKMPIFLTNFHIKNGYIPYQEICNHCFKIDKPTHFELTHLSLYDYRHFTIIIQILCLTRRLTRIAAHS